MAGGIVYVYPKTGSILKNKGIVIANIVPIVGQPILGVFDTTKEECTNREGILFMHTESGSTLTNWKYTDGDVFSLIAEALCALDFQMLFRN